MARRALKEDLGTGDVTSQALVPVNHKSTAVIIARHACVVSGMPVAEAVFREVDPEIVFERIIDDSLEAEQNSVLARISGKTRSILAGERVALNFMQRMTGIATQTREFVRRAARSDLAILDTRKTTPTMRRFEKYAVLCGGGRNHRMGLDDMALIKDNHRKIWAGQGRGGLARAVAEIRASFPGVPVEIEVENVRDMTLVLKEKPDWIMLDNMTVEDMRECVKLCAGKCKLEASGGITLDMIESVGRTGVDAVSLGCLTHSVKSADLSLEMEL